jgi:hypothetical protein
MRFMTCAENGPDGCRCTNSMAAVCASPMRSRATSESILFASRSSAEGSAVGVEVEVEVEVAESSADTTVKVPFDVLAHAATPSAKTTARAAKDDDRLITRQL